MRSFIKKLGYFLSSLIFLVCLSQSSVFALSDSQQQLFDSNILLFDDQANTNSTNCSTDTVNLTGSDREEQTWNFFKGKGLSDEQVAGIMGNIQMESGFDPENIEDPAGRTTDPSNLTSQTQGYGLIQWTPGDEIIGLAQKAGLTTPIYQLGTQLELIWHHMNNDPSITKGFDLTQFKQITNEKDATDYFENQMEAAQDGGNLPKRETFATQILQKYGGTSGSGTTADNSCGTTIADCQNANGVAKILCAAKAYDTASYQLGGGHAGGAAFHQSCPTIGPSCVLDCSGLVNIAVYDAFNVDLIQDTTAEAADSSHWQHITLSQLQPGDLVQPNPDHVTIVDHVQGSTIYIFGAHTSNWPQPKQISGFATQAKSSDVYLHYVGPGV